MRNGDAVSAKLRYRMESVGGEPVSLTAFAHLTAEMTQLLTELDRARSDEPAVDWIITDLDFGSAIVEVEGIPITSVADVSPTIVREAMLALELASTGRPKPDVPTPAWRHALSVAEIVRDRATTVEISSNGAELRLAPRPMPVPTMATTDDEARTTEAVSTIEGSLDTVYLHDEDDRHFDLWDAIYGRRVRVDFTAEHLSDVKRGLGERVRVHGLVVFDHRGRPHRVRDVRSIRVLGLGRTPEPGSCGAWLAV
jgi:hypothetical protein